MFLFEVKDLKKTYVSDDVATPVLKGVSFGIKEGEFLAIMGPSGSGKSTLLHILGFLDRPSEGRYLFEEKLTSEYSEEELAQVRNKKMGFVFQFFNLLPRMSVLENVKLPLVYGGVKENKRDDIALRAIKSVGLLHRADFLPTKLSGGEKQRVAIARALVNNPKVIFADEPTGNLDSGSGQVVMEVMDRLNKEENHTIILVTHETNTASFAERIIKIHDGMIESDERSGQKRPESLIK
jgi:putative ABC transport system ATP-binding protein